MQIPFDQGNNLYTCIDLYSIPRDKNFNLLKLHRHVKNLTRIATQYANYKEEYELKGSLGG
jgi:hypothetical protein